MKSCNRCHQDKPLSAFYWRSDKDRYRNTCVDCSRTTKTTATRRRIARAVDAREGKKPCAECFDLTHRVDGMRCRVCGLGYAPEPPVTVEDIHARPRENYWGRM